MKDCTTCRWVGCRNYGKEMGACYNYIMSLEEEKRIERIAEENKKHIKE